MPRKKKTTKKARKRIRTKSTGASSSALQYLTHRDYELDSEHKKRITNYKEFQKYILSKDAKEVRELLENGIRFQFANDGEEPSNLCAYYNQERNQIAIEADLNPETRPGLVLGMASILTHSFNSLFLEISGLREPSTTFKDLQELLLKIAKN